jgi:hypothetical protein
MVVYIRKGVLEVFTEPINLLVCLLQELRALLFFEPFNLDENVQCRPFNLYDLFSVCIASSEIRIIFTTTTTPMRTLNKVHFNIYVLCNMDNIAYVSPVSLPILH